jgi:deoxyribonuclease-1-like protein
MLQLRRQWPAATAAIAGLAFVLNHYRIAGLENLRLERRSPSEIERRETSGDIWASAFLNTIESLDAPADAPIPSRTPPNNSQYVGTGLKSFPTTTPSQVPNQQFPNPQLPAIQPSELSTPHNSSQSPLAMPSVPTSPAGVLEPDLGRMLTINEKFAMWENRSIATGSLSGALTGAAGTIRIASFHVPALGAAKLAKPHVFEMLVRILRRFDVVALQGIQSNRDDILPLLVERLNQSGRSYDYMIGPRVGRSAQLEQFAYIFDTQRLETDRYQLYTVEDPDDLIVREPLVAWFRTKGHAPQHAFTFSMINVHIDPDFAQRERELLPSLIQAVQNDGRGEDDWILLGDFQGGDSELFPLTKVAARLALIGIPTDVAGTRMLDEIALSGPATVEFNGKVGAYDFLRQYNLSLEQALEVSDHLPVWAEFSTLEGAEPGRIAPVRNEIR